MAGTGDVRQVRPEFTKQVDEVKPMLHRLYCECGRELCLPQGIWHKAGFKWHYKCECGIQFQSEYIFPRVEFEMTNAETGKKERFNTSGYRIRE